jgi:aryl-alcohol dehydrogenase-like predicted oxidoreductase
MISPFTLGSMEFGSKVAPTEASRLLDRAIDAGVIALDTANVYASGRSEEIVGRLITGRRDRFILATTDLTIDEELSKRIDEIVAPGGATVPYYLDDSFADFRLPVVAEDP